MVIGFGCLKKIGLLKLSMFFFRDGDFTIILSSVAAQGHSYGSKSDSQESSVSEERRVDYSPPYTPYSAMPGDVADKSNG